MVLLHDYDGFTYNCFTSDYLAAVLWWFYLWLFGSCIKMVLLMMVLFMVIWQLYYNGFTYDGFIHDYLAAVL